MSRISPDAVNVKDRRHTVPTSPVCAPENSSEPRQDGSEELHTSPRQALASPESSDRTANPGAASKDAAAHQEKKPLSLDAGDTDVSKRLNNLQIACDETWTDVKPRVQDTKGTRKVGANPPALEPRHLSVAEKDGAIHGRRLPQTSDADRNSGVRHRELQPQSSRGAISASRRQVACYTERGESSREGGAGDTDGTKHGEISPQTPDDDKQDTNKQRATVRAPHKLDESQCRSLGPATKDRGNTCSAAPQKSFAADDTEDESKPDSGDDLMQVKPKFGVPVTQLLPVNCDLKPSKTLDEYWLYEENFLNYRMNSDYPDSEDGKWMTFHPVEELDEAWAWAKHLYRSGQLPEIKRMNVATAAFNPEYADKDPSIKVICFFCGPVSNKLKMLRIGRQVAQLMNYQAKHIAYRTVNQYRQKIPGCIYKIYKW